jgi:hypothetical protein
LTLDNKYCCGHLILILEKDVCLKFLPDISLVPRAGYFDPGGDRDFVAEDDEDDADLLCDFAPGALQADGSVGLMDSEGTHVLLPPTPAPRAQSSYKMTRRPTALQRRAMILGRAQFARQRQEAHVLSRQFDLNGSGWDDREQCLSDNWHPTDSSDSSITSLRQQYHQVFGKETSSNNRQWLLKRLASSHFGNNSGGEIDLSAGDNSGNGTGSNLEEYTGSDEIAATHHYNSIGNGWENMFAKHSGTGCTGRKQAVNKTHGTEKLVTNLSELSPVAVTLQVPGYDLQAKTRGNHQSSKRGRNTNSHSAEGGTAKTGGSSAGKKSKKCKLPELGDHSASEQPVKSCKNSHQVPQRKLFTSRKISGGDRRGNVGASGRRSKHHNPWALEEAVALVDGVAKCGGGKWADIKKLGYQAIEHRTAVDLKDKWRNLLRIAMLPHQPLKTAGDKKREIPADLLTRVRDLASKQGKKAAQDGRVRSGSH